MTLSMRDSFLPEAKEKYFKLKTYSKTKASIKRAVLRPIPEAMEE
jgi:hypothetical protein